MGIDKIIIKGAREHNLKNIDIELPRDKLIVMTGLSGSGKSSLAFDTIYADGQRTCVRPSRESSKQSAPTCAQTRRCATGVLQVQVQAESSPPVKDAVTA